jgi:trimeric autotransporter adhesin
MKKSLLFSVCILCLHCSYSQTIWEPLGSGVNNAVRTMCADTVNNILYIGGNFSHSGNMQVNNIAQWNGMYWDSLSSGTNGFNVLAIIMYKEKLLAGGGFISMGGLPCNGLAYWEGKTWHCFTDAESCVFKISLIGDDLYTMGCFENIGGIASSKIARYDGNQWHAFPTLDSTTGGWCMNAAVFQDNKLYVGGNFQSTIPGPKMADIAIFDGTSWLPWGNGLSGPDTHVNDIIQYKGKIYIGGYFKKSGGDPGNFIAAWDGTQWDDVGGGLNAQPRSFIIYKDELYTGGPFTKAGNLDVRYIAKWDGEKWHSLNSDFSHSPSQFAILKNELYVGGNFRTINGDSISRVAKYNQATGTFEHGFNLNRNIFIYPNPANDAVTLQLTNFNGEGMIAIYSSIGSKVYEKRMNFSHPDELISIDLSHLATGLYQVRIESSQGIFASKFLKQ